MKPKNTDSTPCLIHVLFLITLLAVAAGCVHVTVELQNPPANSNPTGSNSTGGGTETDTRAFYFVGPPPSGTFQTVQLQTVAIDGETTICSKPVTNFVVRFMTNQIPASGEVKFRGYLSNESASALVPNTDYVLQYWVSIANNGCC